MAGGWQPDLLWAGSSHDAEGISAVLREQGALRGSRRHTLVVEEHKVGVCHRGALHNEHAHPLQLYQRRSRCIVNS